MACNLEGLMGDICMEDICIGNICGKKIFLYETFISNCESLLVGRVGFVEKTRFILL